MAKFSSDGSFSFSCLLFLSFDLYHEQICFFLSGKSLEFFLGKGSYDHIIQGCEFEFGGVCLKLPFFFFSGFLLFFLRKLGSFYIITR
jgi:hypothetical protein